MSAALTEREAIRIVRELERRGVRDKSYRRFAVGEEVGRFLRTLRWSDKSQNTLDTYEIVLSRLALEHGDFDSLAPFDPPDGIELVREFLDRHWGDSSPATRTQRLATVRSFFAWAVEDGRMTDNPARTIKPPRHRQRERQAYSRDVIQKLIAAQPSLRDQVALQLLGRLGLRKNELRLLRIDDVDLVRAQLTIHGKGNKVVVMPIGFAELRDDLYLHIVGEGRQPGEFLLYPRTSRTRPMDPSSVQRWFKRALEHAGLPSSIEIHELRHSAADELWRVTGNLVLAQKLLRHESVATTQLYLHPSREDLAEAMKAVDEAWKSTA